MASITGTLNAIQVTKKPIAATKAEISQLLSRDDLRNAANNSVSATMGDTKANSFLSGNTLYIVGGIASVLVIAILIVLFKK